MKKAVVTLETTATLTFSQDISHHPKNPGEKPDEFDQRLFRKKAYDRTGTVYLKASAIMNSIIDGAKQLKERIQGKGMATVGGLFERGGILVEDDISLGVRVADLIETPVFVNADGRGSGKRVVRRFPEIEKGVRFTVPVFVLNDEITREQFEKAVRSAGMFIGVGQHFPQNRGTHGRFKLVDLKWIENWTGEEEIVGPRRTSSVGQASARARR